MIIDFPLAESVLAAQPYSRVIGARLAGTLCAVAQGTVLTRQPASQP